MNELERIMDLLNTLGYEQIHRTEQGERIFRTKGGKFAIVHCAEKIISVNSVQMTFDGADYLLKGD